MPFTLVHICLGKTRSSPSDLSPQSMYCRRSSPLTGECTIIDNRRRPPRLQRDRRRRRRDAGRLRRAQRADLRATEYCDHPRDTCGADDGEGQCTARPEGCPEDYPGVCGCDGRFYCNGCIAHQAGMDVSEDPSCIEPEVATYAADRELASGARPRWPSMGLLGGPSARLSVNRREHLSQDPPEYDRRRTDEFRISRLLYKDTSQQLTLDHQSIAIVRDRKSMQTRIGIELKNNNHPSSVDLNRRVHPGDKYVAERRWRRERVTDLPARDDGRNRMPCTRLSLKQVDGKVFVCRCSKQVTAEIHNQLFARKLLGLGIHGRKPLSVSNSSDVADQIVPFCNRRVWAVLERSRLVMIRPSRLIMCSRPPAPRTTNAPSSLWMKTSAGRAR
ncbi:uncharacterized protein SOCE26_023880 [Sorangium cellulosum]|uniref:Kazal-like domain-containing protein n=1 Tax=Sorangium cellulosum TaxID=56 RepID=A0A2L0ENX5_SORCE|nr:uncharacterized protein SOCE26_023880 [Sorangium cellulosum]